MYYKNEIFNAEVDTWKIEYKIQENLWMTMTHSLGLNLTEKLWKETLTVMASQQFHQ